MDKVVYVNEIWQKNISEQRHWNAGLKWDKAVYHRHHLISNEFAISVALIWFSLSR